MDEYLKELGELAEINDEVLITATKGAKRITENFKKLAFVRCIRPDEALPPTPICKVFHNFHYEITGHHTEKSFLKYIKISQEDDVNKLINHPFFAWRMKVVKGFLYGLGSLLIAGNVLGLLGNLGRIKDSQASGVNKLAYYLGLCSMAVIGTVLIFIAYRIDKKQKRNKERQELLNSLNQMK